jgi:WD40 repeat protein
MMKRRASILSVLLALLAISGLVLINAAWGQDDNTPESFELIQQLGRARPQGIQYDPNFDRFVMIDTAGRLVLVDGATFAVQHVLYEQGTYSAYAFSHDGRWLALGIDRRVELWDTQTGTMVEDVVPEEALAIQNPLQFSYDDGLLMINALVPAPAELRRSENDTSNLPYLWDLPAARDIAETTLPRFFELYSFYDYRYGFIMGPNRKVITGLPQRLQIMDVADKNLPILAEIPSGRAERDPISVWHSLRDDHMYVMTQKGDLVQVDTTTGTPYTLPLGRDLTYSRLPDVENMLLSDQARIIGAPLSRENNSFLRLLFGGDYRSNWNYHPLTVMLIDILNPITVDQEQMGLLVYTFDDAAGYGMLEFLRPDDVHQMALHPDGAHLMVRRASGDQPIEVYNLDTGVLELTIHPLLPDPDGRRILAYNAAGDVIVSDFERFDAETGDVLYEDPHYFASPDSYTFLPDSRSIVTISGSNWWLWDIETGEVIRREKVNLRGSVIGTSPDAQRYLTRIDGGENTSVEIANVSTELRRSVAIENLPGRSIENIIPSPDWENYLVLYAPYGYSQHYPGREMAVYNMDRGKLWFLAGDDLPPYDADYGWLDNQTWYIVGSADSAAQPARIYGLDYHASGLPNCLVETFPDDWTRWLDLWERLNARLRGDELGRLTQRLCAAKAATVEEVDAVFFPTPTATRCPTTPIPSVIAGVPACLTLRFPGEALDYAAIWREMTVGMTPDESAELAVLLCEGLQEAAPLSSPGGGSTADDNLLVMTFDIQTGMRSFGGYVPPKVTPAMRSLEVALDEFERSQDVDYVPYDAQFSPDGALIAMRDNDGYIDIYRLITPYPTLVANATATAALREQATPKSLSVRPTATQAFDYAGMPNPTLTPTVTPTPPPRTETQAQQSQYGQVEELCPSDTLYHVSDPPPDYAAAGQLLVRVRENDTVWTLDAATGRLQPDDTIPDCIRRGGCDFSPDQNWILWDQNDDMIVSRPDGSDARILFHAGSYPMGLGDYYWTSQAAIEYNYREYRFDLSREPVAVVRRYDPATDTTSEPFFSLPIIRVNELATTTLAEQPDGGPLALVSTTFTGAHSTGYKYYIYDRDTGTAAYFARLVDEDYNEIIEAWWHPLGKALYYRYWDSDDWYVFDPITRQHYILGALPEGEWSRDGRYRVTWFTLPSDERDARIKAKQPLPKLSIWDSETGLIRRYCIPETGTAGLSGELDWSPDSRYIAFQTRLPADGDESTVRPRALILDRQTGRVTELTFDVTDIIVWTGG